MASNDNDLLARVTIAASNVIGSWWMIVIQTAAISAWFFLNASSYSPLSRFDNDRYDTLRLLLALQSVYTAPLILMAQRRVSSRDREVLHEIDEYEKKAAEARLRAVDRRIRLEEKIDKLLAHHVRK